MEDFIEERDAEFFKKKKKSMSQIQSKLPYSKRWNLKIRHYIFGPFKEEKVLPFMFKKRKDFVRRMKQRKVMEKELEEDDIDDLNNEELARELSKLHDKKENKYDEEDDFIDDGKKLEKIAKLIKVHDKSPPSDDLPLCITCKMSVVNYFCDCGCFYPYCYECFDDQYSYERRDIFLPSRCPNPSCKKRIRKIFAIQKRNENFYDRAIVVESTTTLNSYMESKKEYLYNTFNVKVTDKNGNTTLDNTNICQFEKVEMIDGKKKMIPCNKESMYNILCGHLQEFCEEHDDQKDEIIKECCICSDKEETEEHKKNKDFIQNWSRSPCEIEGCDLFKAFNFNCGHLSRFCSNHTLSNNSKYSSSLKPFNIPSMCHVCFCRNIRAITHPLMQKK